MMICWLISDTSAYELPCAVFDTLREACQWLNIPLETAKTAFKRHGVYRSRYFIIERVQIAK